MHEDNPFSAKQRPQQMLVWVSNCKSTFMRDAGTAIAVEDIRRFQLVFPAERLVHRSRGIDRTCPMPTRCYSTPSGLWSTDDPNLMRLIHSDFEFLLQRVAQIPLDTCILAASTNYGNNPYYCIRWPGTATSSPRLFHLQQERLNEQRFGIQVQHDRGEVRIKPVQLQLRGGRKPIPQDALVLTAPVLVWESHFVGWESYARQTYDCRHVVNLQYARGKSAANREFERVRKEIQRLEKMWEDRDRYVQQVMKAAADHGFAVLYQRLVLGVGCREGRTFTLLWSGGFGRNAEEAASLLLREYPGLQVALQLNEGGGSGFLEGTPSRYRVRGPSDYRRGRSLCALVIERTASRG